MGHIIALPIRICLEDGAQGQGFPCCWLSFFSKYFYNLIKIQVKKYRKSIREKYNQAKDMWLTITEMTHQLVDMTASMGCQPHIRSSHHNMNKIARNA